MKNTLMKIIASMMLCIVLISSFGITIPVYAQEEIICVDNEYVKIAIEDVKVFGNMVWIDTEIFNKKNHRISFIKTSVQINGVDGETASMPPFIEADVMEKEAIIIFEASSYGIDNIADLNKIVLDTTIYDDNYRAIDTLKFEIVKGKHFLVQAQATVNSQATAMPKNAEVLEWHKSNDDVIAVAIESINSSSYPKIKINLTYKVDEDLLQSGTWTWDASNAISQYAQSHSSYKNRKVDIAANIDSVYFNREGIHYTVKIDWIIGGEVKDESFLGINLWQEFPDIFVDYDVFRIANAIELYREKAGLYNPSSLTINGDPLMLFDDDDESVIYYKVCLNAMNRVGGYVNQDILIIYNTKTGKMDIVEGKEGSYIIRQGAANLGVFDIINTMINVGIKGTSIWSSLVEEAME